MRILIADDDVTSRLVLKAVATKLGHECLIATDGSKAWELLLSEGVDVLLTDWMMPGIDGPELCRRVRVGLSGRYIYVVLITSLANQDQVMEGMGAGADDYLIKPVDPFTVQSRLVAAERVTTLHRQLAEVSAQLEIANAEATRLSLTDALTGLGNRRRMEEDLASAHAHALRTGRGYGVTLFDIDFFKLFNDHYGHLAGDDVLRRVAKCFDSTVRMGENLYRFGGEEFLLLLTDCGEDEVVSASERIREAVAQLGLVHDFKPTTPPVVTVSGGVALFTSTSECSVDDVLKQADEALFEAKSSGRNRVQVSRDNAQGMLQDANAGG